MSKLYFRYGAMNSGKSTALLQVAFNYEEREQRVLLAKPQVDTKGESKVVSRLGHEREVDFLIPHGANVRDLFRGVAAGDDPTALLEHVDVAPVACLLVDEAQFLESSQVEDLLRIAVLDGVPVIAYGIRTDFLTNAFPGSARLMDLAHSLEELKTICRCGRKAIFNTRKIGGEYVFAGDQVAIDGNQEVTYESLCANCYLEASGGRLG
ncbi:thymidine kinase [Neomicrococcus aestuarii]|uniref:Thymidine kinase n=1 Tax=Neomicrococcus aestuarii TaxID=556325 RepID=A0A1L2ZRS6_9MICC|nr:thymidine kinase [Neomicrococcus aestuarii]APF41799.1 thymidine kinase [Neomicrococcus aestuarii]MBB5512580.1 thymidine kinase [Neomicrococcus aestuarii]